MRITSSVSTRAWPLASACVAVAVSACTGLDASSGATAPSNLSLLPYCVENAAATPVTLRGTLPVKPVVSLSGGQKDQVDTTYRAWIGDPASSNAVELTNVIWVDAKSATGVVPGGLAPGLYPLFVESPFGNRVKLDKPLEVRTAGLCPPPGAVLTTVAKASPMTATVGQEVTVSAVVQNGGQAPATAVAATLAAPPASFDLVSAPAGPQDIPGGEAASYTWKFKPGATTPASGVAFEIDAAGTDLVGAAVAAPHVRTNLLAVNPPATLTVAARPPQAAYVGQQFRLGLELTNTGSAAATVAPVVTATATNGVQLTVVPPTGGQNVPGPGRQLLEWAYTANAPCDVTFTVDLSNATDANSGAHITLPAIPPATVPVAIQPQLETRVTLLTRSTGYAVTGETVVVNADVRNIGTSTVRTVSASMAPATLPRGLTQSGNAPGAQDIAPGQTGRFSWTYSVGASPGGAFTVNVSVGDLPAVNTATAQLAVRYPIHVAVSGLRANRTITFTLSTPSNSDTHGEQVALFGSNTSDTFPIPVANGATYSVTYFPPSGQQCSWTQSGDPPAGAISTHEVNLGVTCN